MQRCRRAVNKEKGIKMEFIKKQSIGVWISLVSLILAIAGLIAYQNNISSDGYFKGASVSAAIPWTAAAIVMIVAAIAAAQIPLGGMADKLMDLAASALRILAPALLIGAAMSVLSGRVEGIGYILFSNEEVLQEVQTQANLASVNSAVTCIVLLAVAGAIAMIAAFFGLKKKAH